MMKHKKWLICLMAVLATVSAAGLTGCDQMKNVADTAKNTVVSLADQVTNFEMNQEAEALNTVLNNFKNGILDGTINSRTYGNAVTAQLPSPEADTAARKAALQSLTVYSALEEQGMLSRYPEDRMAEFVSCDGVIKYKGSIDPKEETGLPLSYTTTLAAALNLS